MNDGTMRWVLGLFIPPTGESTDPTAYTYTWHPDTSHLPPGWHAWLKSGRTRKRSAHRRRRHGRA